MFQDRHYTNVYLHWSLVKVTLLFLIIDGFYLDQFIPNFNFIIMEIQEITDKNMFALQHGFC